MTYAICDYLNPRVCIITPVAERSFGHFLHRSLGRNKKSSEKVSSQPETIRQLIRLYFLLSMFWSIVLTDQPVSRDRSVEATPD